MTEESTTSASEEKRRGRPPKNRDLVDEIEADMAGRARTPELPDGVKVVVLNTQVTYHQKFPDIDRMVAANVGLSSAGGGVLLPAHSILANKPITIGATKALVCPDAVEHLFKNSREMTSRFYQNGVVTRRPTYSFYGEE